MVAVANKYNITMLGPNCLGVKPANKGQYPLPPFIQAQPGPQIGGVSFVAQSGAVGSTVLDLISQEGFGLSKFDRYRQRGAGREVDILEYLMKDDETKVIACYTKA